MENGDSDHKSGFQYCIIKMAPILVELFRRRGGGRGGGGHSSSSGHSSGSSSTKGGSGSSSSSSSTKGGSGSSSGSSTPGAAAGAAVGTSLSSSHHGGHGGSSSRGHGYNRTNSTNSRSSGGAHHPKKLWWIVFPILAGVIASLAIWFTRKFLKARMQRLMNEKANNEYPSPTGPPPKYTAKSADESVDNHSHSEDCSPPAYSSNPYQRQ